MSTGKRKQEVNRKDEREGINFVELGGFGCVRSVPGHIYHFELLGRSPSKKDVGVQACTSVPAQMQKNKEQKISRKLQKRVSAEGHHQDRQKSVVGRGPSSCWSKCKVMACRIKTRAARLIMLTRDSCLLTLAGYWLSSNRS
jgi:hypothetical protein